jgi:hypothetical protein
MANLMAIGDCTMRKNVGNSKGEGETNQGENGEGQLMKHGDYGRWKQWGRSSMAIVGAGDGDDEKLIFLGFRWTRDEWIDCGRLAGERRGTVGSTSVRTWSVCTPCSYEA